MVRGKRQTKDLWVVTRKRIWLRDLGKCQGPHCCDTLPWSLPLNRMHCDHILEVSKGGSNQDNNLRTLCRRCHVLRSNHSHQGMIATALRDGVIPADWRSLVWDG